MLDRGPGSTVSWALVALSVVGMAVSVELTLVHHRAYRHRTSGCDISERVSCSKVALTKESEFLGVPISVWGLCTYFGFAVLGVWALRRRGNGSWPWGLVTWGAAGTVGYSVYLAYVAYGRYRLVCLWCTALYVVNVLLLGVGILALVRRRLGPVRALVQDIRYLAERPVVTAGLALVALTVAAGLVAYYPSPGTKGPPVVQVDISKSVMAHPPGRRSRPVARGRARQELPLVDSDTPVKGPEDAPIIVVEFSDYECPFCRKAHENVAAALQKYPRRIRLAHRHFPLDSKCNPLIHGKFHEHSCVAARAAICAQEQGKFWEMHELLFAHPRSHTASGLRRLAERCGLDVAAFERCLSAERTRKRLARDISLGIQLKLRGTPTFFLEGPRVKRTRVSGLIGVDLFDKLFESLRNEARSPKELDAPGLHQ